MTIEFSLLDFDFSCSLGHTLNLPLVLPTPGYFNHLQTGTDCGWSLGPILRGKIIQTMLEKEEVKYNHNDLTCAYFIST